MKRQCEATVYFLNPYYLPMTFSFSATLCDSEQVNKFQIPKYTPNGEADVVWYVYSLH